MMKLDDRIVVRARRNHTEMLNALAEVGQSEVAALLGVSESTISRFKDQMEFCSAFLAAIEKQVADERSRFVADSRWHSVCDLASVGLEFLRDRDGEFKK